MISTYAINCKLSCLSKLGLSASETDIVLEKHFFSEALFVCWKTGLYFMACFICGGLC